MIRKISNSLMLGLVFALTGCVAPTQSSGPQAHALEKARDVFISEKALLLWVPSFTDPSSRVRSKAVRDFKTLSEMGKTGTINVAVASPKSSCARLVICDALSSIEGQLPGLTLLFVGDAADREAVQVAAEGHGAKFRFEEGQ